MINRNTKDGLNFWVLPDGPPGSTTKLWVAFREVVRAVAERPCRPVIFAAQDPRDDHDSKCTGCPMCEARMLIESGRV